jgi:hypothetical protein
VPLLGRHVGGRPGDRSLSGESGESGDAEVDELAVAVALDDAAKYLIATISPVVGRRARTTRLSAGAQLVQLLEPF